MAVKRRKKWLLGVGFDHEDGHKRVTKGENFLLLGGSKQTHEEMQEKTIKLTEELKKKHQTLDRIELNELKDIAEKVGLYPIRSESRKTR